MFKTIAALAISMAAAGAVVFASSANAAPVDTAIVRVSYEDLNLKSSAGAAALHRRVVAAADLLCQSREPFGSLAERTWSERCRAGAVARGDMAIAAVMAARH